MHRCEIPRCRGEGYVNYFGRLVCESHWDELNADDAPPNALRMALGLPAAPVAAMEESMDDGAKKAKAEAPAKAEAAGKAKAAKIKPAKREAAPKEPRPAKGPEAKPKREAVENPVVFAFRLSEADRTRIHQAAGPAGATRFVRAAALAAALGDTKTFEALVAQAKSNQK